MKLTNLSIDNWIVFINRDENGLSDYQFYGNTLKTWLTALGIFVFAMVVLQIIKWLMAKRLTKVVEQTQNDLDDLAVDLIGQTKSWFILILSLYFGSQILALPDKVRQIDNTITIVVVFIQIAFWGNGIITYWISKKVQKKSGDDAAGATSMNVLGYVAKVVLWSVILILALDNIPGVEVDSLIASLGISGVAVALAVQNVLGDLFASLSIALDKPFVIGDFVTIGDYAGTIERIGLNSTRIRSLYGEELVFSNSDLVKSRINNFKSMARRRVQFNFGLSNPFHNPLSHPHYNSRNHRET